MSTSNPEGLTLLILANHPHDRNAKWGKSISYPKKHQISINHPLGYPIHRGRYMDYLRLMDIKGGEIGCS